MIANESCRGFGGDNCDRGGTSSLAVPSSQTIEQYIVEGAGYYLQSYSDMLLLLNKVEMSEIYGLNYEEAQGIINSAINRLENAKTAYFGLKTLAAVTPYNPDVIHLLVTFDYKNFQKEKGLNPYIFNQVETFLSKGDIRGVYDKLYEDIDTILGKLYNVKYSLDKNEFPVLEELWRINQVYSESISFGQDVAEVFYGI
jgi:hypothetical protein